MKILVVNGCVRGEKSRTQKLLDAFLHTLKDTDQPPEVQERKLTELNLQYLAGDFFEERERLLEEGNRDHPRFDLAHEFSQADAVVVAAPFWDLGFPAVLKVYIENICVDGITFICKATGMEGICKAKKMVFLTTRGGVFGDGPYEQGARYLEAMSHFFGIGEFSCIAAEGLDATPEKAGELMAEAIREAEAAALKL